MREDIPFDMVEYISRWAKSVKEDMYLMATSQDSFYEREKEMDTVGFKAGQCFNICAKPMVNDFQLDCCTAAPCAPAQSAKAYNPPLKNPVKKDKAMYYDEDGCSVASSTQDLAVKAVHYLEDRLDNVRSKKVYEAEETFLPVTPPPSTVKDLREYITNGWLVVDDAYKDDRKIGYGWTSYLMVQDPSKPRDRKKYDAACEMIQTDFTKALDVIKVLPQAEGLKALNEFEAKTYH